MLSVHGWRNWVLSLTMARGRRWRETMVRTGHFAYSFSEFYDDTPLRTAMARQGSVLQQQFWLHEETMETVATPRFQDVLFARDPVAAEGSVTCLLTRTGDAPPAPSAPSVAAQSARVCCKAVRLPVRNCEPPRQRRRPQSSRCRLSLLFPLLVCATLRACGLPSSLLWPCSRDRHTHRARGRHTTRTRRGTTRHDRVHRPWRDDGARTDAHPDCPRRVPRGRISWDCAAGR